MLLEVQTLDIISINVWQVLISLANLLLLFLVMKKFLFGPINRIFAARRADVDKAYAEAEAAKAAAEADRAEYESRLSGIHEEESALLRDAKARAERLSDEIVADARTEATVLRERAEADIEQEKKRARSDMRREITELSVELAGRILDREIDGEAQHDLIDGFLDGLEENDDE